MRCTQCAAVSFSAAARPLVERGYRCPQCGGELVLAPEGAPVGVAAEGRAEPAGERSGGAPERSAGARERRFDRE
jgi:hypothetical protein